MSFIHSYIGPDELIYNNDGEIHSGGFSVNSIMLKNGLSPIMTMNDNNVNVDANTGKNQLGGEKVSDLFNNLVIPNWSLAYNYKNGVFYQGGSITRRKHYDGVEDDDIMEEDLHEKLLNLVKVDKSEMKNNSNNILSNKKNTKKFLNAGRKNKKNITKKQKNKKVY